MSFRRRVSWSAALQGIKADRIQRAPGVLSARSYVETIAKLRRLPLFTAAGGYDRAAIMTMAVAAAKQHQASTGATWADSMSIALKAAWSAAQHARFKAAH